MGCRWEFPGGKVEPGETPEQAVCREFMEEFSVPVRADSLIARSEFVHNGETVTLLAYTVQLETELPEWKLSEHTEIRWVEYNAIPEQEFVDSDLRIYPSIKQYIEGILHGVL